jgi:hypothetical protein
MQLPSSINASTIQLGKTYGYDNANNVKFITDAYVSSESRTLDYDGMDRLNVASGPWGGGTIGYDAGGNITNQQLGAYAINYTYNANRVASISGSVSRTYGYDYLGNVTSNGQSTFQYNDASQLNCANCGLSNEVDYQYDGQGFRVSQTVNGRKTYFVQSPGGDLQFEYSPYGLQWTKNIFLNGKRVASENGSDATAVTMTETAAPSSTQYGDSLALTATLSPSAATGTVEFIDGDVSLGTVNVSAGAASLSTTSLSTGSHAITAKYSGDATYQPATATTTITVAQRASSVTLTGPSSAPLGGSVGLTASVTGADPATSVTFFDGASAIGTVAVSNGSAVLSYQVLSAGTHNFTAQYLGDQNVTSATSNVVATTVAQASTSSSITELTPNQRYGSPAMFTISVTGVSSVAVSGTVTVYDGTTVLGSANVTSGSASFSAGNLAVGSHSITAVYSGNTNYLTSTSPPVVQNVTAGPRTTIRSLPPELIEN